MSLVLNTILVAQTLPAVLDRLDGLTPVCNEDGPGLLCRHRVRYAARLALPSLILLLEYLTAAGNGEERYLSVL